MLLATSNQKVELHNVDSEAHSFSIAMNGKAFKVLSDTLYRDKIGSIIREISSNAYDAHIMAGTPDRPFDLHLPDAYEPWFSVQDYGVGLSPAEIRSVFTRYFESTKDQSNDTIGAFGLGAKTPFAYTDQFTVTSCKDGLRTIYSAYLTESGIPSISEMHSEETTDSNGVEIKMAVKREHYNEFRQKAQEQLKFFKVKPNLTNSNNLTIVDPFEGKDFIKFSNNNFQYVKGISTSWIVQGNVGYPFDCNQFNSVTPDKQLQDFLLSVLRSGHFKLIVPIGTIGVTASRESMEYNNQTVNNLSVIFKDIQKTIADDTKKSYQECKTFWEKGLFVNNLPYFFSNQEVQSWETTPYPKQMALNLNKHFAITLKDQKDFMVKGIRNNYTIDTLAFDSEKTYYVVTSDCKYQKARINILKNNYQLMHNSLLVYPGDGKTRQDFVDFLMGCPADKIKYLSDVAYAPAPRVKNASPKTKFYKANGQFDPASWTKMYESLEDFLEEEDCIIIETNRLNFVGQGYTQVSAFNTFNNFGAVEDMPTLIGVPKTVFDKLVKKGQKTIAKWLEENREAGVAKLKKQAKAYANYAAIDGLMSLSYSNFLTENKISNPDIEMLNGLKERFQAKKGSLQSYNVGNVSPYVGDFSASKRLERITKEVKKKLFVFKVPLYDYNRYLEKDEIVKLIRSCV